MNKITLSVLTLATAAALAISAQAHDPSEHMKDAEKPDCAAMKDMDHSKMDMNDPVTMAMMKKCMNTSDHDDQGQSDHEQGKHNEDKAEHHDDEDTKDSDVDDSPDQ